MFILLQTISNYFCYTGFLIYWWLSNMDTLFSQGMVFLVIVLFGSRYESITFMNDTCKLLGSKLEKHEETFPDEFI